MSRVKTEAHKAQNRKYMSEYRKNPENSARIKEWRKKNRDKTSASYRNWRKENRETHNQWVRDYQKNKYKSDPDFKITTLLRTRLRLALNGVSKSTKTISLLGCSIAELRAHLESQWTPGMSWDNYNLQGWHIDHKRPCASFDLKDPEQQKQCFHYTNLQPLWAVDNYKKSDTYE